MNIDFSLLEGGYLRDLLDQPRVLERTLAGLQESERLTELARDLDRGRFRRVVLTGMGASYHSFLPLYFSLNRRCVTTLLVETSELIHSMPQAIDAGTLLIILSQSGRSVEALRLLEMRGGAPVIAATNHADAPLPQQADAVVLTRAGEEASVSCKTFVASVLALQWLRGVLCAEDRSRVADELHQAAPATEAYLKNWRHHVEELSSATQDMKDLFLVGRGDSLASVGTGGLILKESAHFHAEGMTCSAFRHGPFELTGPATAVLIFAGDPRTRALNATLAADVRKAGGRAFWIGPDSEIDAFRIPAAPDAVRPILEILPVQLVSLALAALAGHQPGDFKLLTKVTTIE